MDTQFATVSQSLGNQLLIVLVVLMIFGIAGPLLITIYQFVKFKKMSFEKSSLSKIIMSSIFAVLSVALVLDALGFVFYYGENFNLSYSTSKTLVISMIALSAVCVVFVYGVLIFANQYIAFGINKENVFIFGDLYQTSKVISFVVDEEDEKISLHIGIGKRSVKRVRFSMSSLSGQCVKASSEILGMKPIVGKDKEIYLQETQDRQEEFRKSITKTQSQMSASSKKTSDDKKVEEKKED